LQTRELWY